MKRFSLIPLLLALLFAASCGSDTVDFGPYEPESASGARGQNPYSMDELLHIDTAWMQNYALSYSFYSKDSGNSDVTEGKTERFYQAVDNGSGQMTYLTQEDGYMLQYVLDPAKMQGTCAVVTDGSMETLHSGFAQLSACDPYLPVYENVTHIGAEPVGKRAAEKYKQVEKDAAGQDAKIAYIWIDDEYCFASRCELYDVATGELQLSWELKSFTRGVRDENVRVDLAGYAITQQ